MRKGRREEKEKAAGRESRRREEGEDERGRNSAATVYRLESQKARWELSQLFR